MRDVNAVGGGWTNQLAWGSDRRGAAHDDGRHRRVAFQLHRGPHRPKKTVVPFATENDIQALLTMIAYC